LLFSFSVGWYSLSTALGCSMGGGAIWWVGWVKHTHFSAVAVLICRHGEHMPMMGSALEHFGSILIMSHHLHLHTR
jgi:hypothetical protein